MNTISKVSLSISLALAAVSASAESTYGYASSGTGTVTATARVNLAVNVAKLILLRVGSTDTTVDTKTWNVGASIPSVPTAAANGASTSVDWNGAAPSLTKASDPAAFNVYAWTNATTPTISCNAAAFAAGGPTKANFAVTVTGTVPHPGGGSPTLANCDGATTAALSANSLMSGTWRYVLDDSSAATWVAGAYTTQVTYTATGL